MQSTETGPRWYEGLSAGHWMVLAVASAGWVFDVYEGQLFTIFKTPMLTELAGGSPAAIEWQGNLGLAAFLLGGAAGGLFFGVLGDRFGRVRIMAVHDPRLFGVLRADGVRQSALQVHVLRFLVALGAGGEWAVAAALVAETFPAHARAAASGIFHASSILGSGAGVADRHGLRRAGHLALGFPPGTGAGASGPLDPAEHSRARALGRRGQSASSMMRAPSEASSGAGRSARALRPRAMAVAGAPGAGTGHRGAGDLLGHLRLGPGAGRSDRSANGPRRPSARQLGSRAYLLMNFTGGLLGLLCVRAAGLVARPAIRVRRLSRGGRDRGTGGVPGREHLRPGALALAVMAFFVLGMHAGYAIYFPELFPTRLCATGSSVCFNLGRVLGAVILIVRGTLGSALGLRWAVVAMSGLFWVGLVILVFAPRRAGGSCRSEGQQLLDADHPDDSESRVDSSSLERALRCSY